ncbi:ABC transporter permease [Cellulomonas aerilata]|uniref:Sugar ABC transporter permease n=1 Tax=Cellulomonas aerilata TaxID=515326 RepID=A0A512D8G4_9CELL|nr:ABC transporter permease [Cellulomonas aerilata]GEO32759.1 sugar ABC transporter permease [Cellulomonas aerilata]
MQLVRHRLFWPLVALVALLVANTINTPSFMSVRVQDGHLFGALIDIMRNSAPLLLVALGMTLVIATRGIDLSVGAVVAISGAVALSFIGSSPNPEALSTVLVAVGIALALCFVLGVWNGFLVSVLGIQPIIATLVLMTAGRGIAMLITEGQITTITSPAYRVIGSGFWLGLPVSILIAGGIFALVAVLTRRTALGMLIEAVGINPEASRLAGVQSRSIVWTVYAMTGLFAGIAGLMISSNVMAADANNAGLFIELDAILAVVIGGTSLAGGKFSLGGTLIGAFIIQTLTLTVTILGISPSVTPLFKAIVVIAVVLMQAPVVRRTMASRRPQGPRPAAVESKPVEVAA